MFSNVLNAFLVGGTLCAIAQILIDKTKLTPARIMVLYVVAGAFLTLFGIYQKVVSFGGAGATVPIIGFGYSLAKGVMKDVSEKGFFGIFTGGISATSAGVCAVILFGYLAALLCKPKSK